MKGSFLSKRVAWTLLPRASVVVALALGGCTCLEQRIESVIAPPRLKPEDTKAIEKMAAEVERRALRRPFLAASAPARLDPATSDRCDPIDPAVCLFPFPNDHFTVADAGSRTGRRVEFDPASMPRNVFNKAIDPSAWKASDGFSPGPLIVTFVPGLDLEQTGGPSLAELSRSIEPDSPILLIDTQDKKPVLLWSELDAQAGQDGLRSLLIRPAVNLHEGRRYIVALRGMKNARGEVIEPSETFKRFRDDVESDFPAIERRRTHFKAIFATLAEVGVDQRDLFLAWDFTVTSTANLSDRLLKMRDDAFAQLAGDAPERRGLCAKDGYEDVARRVWGSFQVPSYLEGSANPGSRLSLGSDGLPRRTGEITAYFSCIIPQSAFRTPARLAIYGHGTLGSLSEVADSNVQKMANDYNVVFCATNWLGMALTDTVQAFRMLCDVSEFPALIDRTHQGILNTLFLGRLMTHPKGLIDDPRFQGPDGRALIDSEALYFDGNSQGALLGGTTTAIAQDWDTAVLGVVGMNYSLILDRSESFAKKREGIASLKGFFQRSYNDLDRPLVLSLMQMLWDRVDLNGHARHLLADTYADTPRKSVLFHAVFGDQDVPNVASEVLARTLAVPVREPSAATRSGQPYPLFQAIGNGDPTVLTGGSRFFMWDTGACPTPPDNRPPGENGDPHGKLRSDPAVQKQKAGFLFTGGAADDPCPRDEPCFACGGAPCAEICQQAPPAVTSSGVAGSNVSNGPSTDAHDPKERP
ncbi:MAG: hypothetical protein HC897_02385 [Thermoanaerobaculia bacterium]|nr:hypothetical protein [Thermoanaerobaculia bacterium]